MKINEQDKKLIEEAKKVIIKSKSAKLIYTGKVGAALITSRNNIFVGVSLGHYCGIGSCAEYQAIGNMISNGEKEIKKIVAITDKGKIIPPCGKCREMILQSCKKNKDTEVIISKIKKVKLKELLPYPWGGSIEEWK